MTRLEKDELLYALTILNMFKGRNFSLKTEELRISHPSNIIAWLEEKELLVTAMLEAQGRSIERRTVLGTRALNILETPSVFGYKVKILEDINEG